MSTKLTGVRQAKIAAEYQRGVLTTTICSNNKINPLDLYAVLDATGTPRRGKGINYQPAIPFLKAYLQDPTQDLTALFNKHDVGRTSMYLLLKRLDNPTNPNIEDKKWGAAVAAHSLNLINPRLPDHRQCPTLGDLRTYLKAKKQGRVVGLYTQARTAEQCNSQVLNSGQPNPNHNPALPVLKKTVSIAEISTILNLPQNEVRNILRTAGALRPNYERARGETEIDKLRDKIRIMTNRLRELEQAAALDPEGTNDQNPFGLTPETELIGCTHTDVSKDPVEFTPLPAQQTTDIDGWF